MNRARLFASLALPLAMAITTPALALHQCEREDSIVYSQSCVHAGLEDEAVDRKRPEGKLPHSDTMLQELAQAQPKTVDPGGFLPDLQADFQARPPNRQAITETKSDDRENGPIAAGTLQCSDEQILDMAADGDLKALRACRPSRAQLRLSEQRRIGEGRTPLHWAVGNGHGAVVRFLLARGVPLEDRARSDRGGTPLHLAAENGDLELIGALLDGGADIGATDLFRLTPLHRAVQVDQRAAVEMLLSRGADPNALDRAEKTPLMLACRHRSTDLVTLLLKAGADPKRRSITGMTALHYAAQFSPEALAALTAYGVDLDAPDSNGQTPILALARQGIAQHWNSIRQLITQGADVHRAGADGQTLLSLSAAQGHQELFRLLLSQGVDPGQLKLSQLKGSRAIVQLLIERGYL